MIKRTKGFTFIEVLMGLALLGIIVIFTLPTLGNSIKLRNKSYEDTELINYANKVMENIKGSFYENREIDREFLKDNRYYYDYKLEEKDLILLKLKVGRRDESSKEIKFKLLLPKD